MTTPRHEAPGHGREAERVLTGSLPSGTLRVGAPLAAGTVLYASFGLIDLYMVSRLPNASRALAALGICEMVPSMASIIAYGVASAAVARVAGHQGSEDHAGVRRAVHQSFAIMILLSILFGVLGLVGSEFVVRVVLGAPGGVADIAVGYLRVILVGSYGLFLVMEITSVLRAVGASTSAGALMVMGTVLNVFLNGLLMYGTGPRPPSFQWMAPIAEALHAPRLGVEGAAWGSLIARTVPMLLGLPLLIRRGLGPGLSAREWRPDRAELEKLLSIAWPSSTQLVLRVAMVLVFIGLVNRLFVRPGDPTVMAAYAVCLRFETLALFLALGWGAGAATYLGLNVGAGQVARGRRSGWVMSAHAVASAAVLVIVYTLFSDRIVGAFDPDPRVIEVGRHYFRTVAWAYLPLTVGAVLAQAMSGAGKTLPPLVIDASILLLLILPAALLVPQMAHPVPRALWSIVAAAHALPSLVLAVYYSRGTFLK